MLANFIVVFCALCTLVHQIHCEMTLVADINMAGFKGKITFVQQSTEENTTVSYGLNISDYSWQIHEFRMFYAQEGRCETANIGLNHLHNFTGDSQTAIIETSILPDLKTLSGRSILLKHKEQGPSFCATLEEEGKYITLMAKFLSTVAGTLVFRQKANNPDGITSIYSDLFFLDKQTEQSSMKWQIYSGVVTADTNEKKPLSNRCESIGVLYNPNGSQSCSNSENCAIGDLAGKHGNLLIGEEKGDKKKFFSDLHLPLSRSFSIENRTLVIMDSDGAVIACANILGFTERRAKVFVNRMGVNGNVKFIQQSIFDATIIEMHFPNLVESIGHYSIHEWPVPQKFHADHDVCGHSEISGQWNPFGIETSPAPGEGTNDQYAIGDISGKFGAINDNSEFAIYNDWNLPLFGAYSIVGRSLAMHHKNGSKWFCANINLETAMKSAIATFKYPIIGHVLLRQPENDWYHDTQIYMELNYGDGTRESTSGHGWDIRGKKTGSDFDGDGKNRCVSNGNLYQPYDVKKNSSRCHNNSQLECGMGYMTKKHGKITVRSPEGGWSRHFFTDINLPLTGPHSVIGRSMSIAKSNIKEWLSCANIVELPERHVSVTTWSHNQPSEISGVVNISNSYPGILDGLAKVEINLHNLNNEASGFHVHNYPVPREKEHPCSGHSVGGHFIPFGIDIKKSPPAGDGTDDQYELGDLSGKYGNPLDDGVNVSVQNWDTNLPLRGPFSIVGKSIVIHKNDDRASRWVCGNIVEDRKMGSHVYEAFSSFKGELEGYIYLRQYMYKDSSLSDTEVLIDIKSKNDKHNEKHYWNVHVSPVGDESESGCESVGTHYNPFHVNTMHGYDECGMDNPLRCTVGDQSGKLGPYGVGKGRHFFTDVNLPIYGPFSVIGRSFGIFAVENWNSSHACADIIPHAGPKVEMLILIGHVNKTDMVATIAKALHTNYWDMAAETDMAEKSQCKLVTMHFIGPNAKELKLNLEDMMNHNKAALGKYAPADGVCSSTDAVTWSVFALLLSVCVSWMLN